MIEPLQLRTLAAEVQGLDPDKDIVATNAEVLQVVTDNYSAFHANRDQLIGLQEWASKLQAKEK